MEKKKKSIVLKNKNDYILIVIISILIVFSVYLMTYNPIETKILNVRFIVDERIGIDVNSSELNFGKILPGNSAVRRVSAENNFNFPVKMKIFVSKDISNFIFIEREYTLLPEEKILIPITLKIPQQTGFGSYSGELKFEFRKA